MGLKKFYGLQAALFASNSLINETNSLDVNKTTSENTKRNQEYLTSKKELFEPQGSDSEVKKASLLLPVNLIIFEKYYKKLSEWKYTDKYLYDENVLVFNKKEHNQKDKNSLDQVTFYKKDWLTNLTHSQDFQYDLGYRPSRFPSIDNSLNVNWIDGKASSHKLTNLLSLNIPSEINNSFEMHDKIIELDQSFLMKSSIDLYSGYWKSGEMNKKNNVIDQIEYGNLKQDPLRAQDLYHDYWRSSRNCSELKNREDRYLKESRKKVSEGFDSKCDRINLLDFWSFFWNNKSRSIYSSGYVGYRYKSTSYWDKRFFFYSLGNWSLDKPSTVKVNVEEEEKNLWYVDFDDIFVPEVKWTDDTLPKKKELKLSFYVNYEKIKDVDSFLKIASALKYKLKFKLNAKSYEVAFTLKDVLETKSFPISTEEVHISKLSNIAFSNFELVVYSDNSRIKLSSKSGKEFTFKPNLSIIQSRFNVFRYLAIDQDELQNFYYSELKKKQKLDRLFYFAFKKPKDSELEAVSLSDKWIELLNLNVSGSDYSTAATLKFHDFITGEFRTLEISRLLSLPNFEEEYYVKKEPFSSLEELITSQSKQKIGKYFWENMELKLEEKDILNGIEKYSLKLKRNVTQGDTDTSWDTYYKGKLIKVKNDLDRYLIPKFSSSNLNKNIKDQNYRDVFSIDSKNIENLNLSLSDFSFKKVYETQDYVEIEVEYIKNTGFTSNVKLDGKNYQGVKLTGKSKFKINKRDNFIISSDQFPQTNQISSTSGSSYKPEERGVFEGGWLEKTTLPLVISSAVAGGGVTAGAGAFLSKRLRLFF